MNKLLFIALVFLFIIGAVPSNAQHEHHAPATQPVVKPVQKTPLKKTAVKKKTVTQKTIATPVKKDTIPAVDHSQHMPVGKDSMRSAIKDTVPVHQHEHMTPDTNKQMNLVDTMPVKQTYDHSGMDHPGMTDEAMNMSHSYSLNLPMNRNGSGTSWLPDASPMYMYMSGKKTNWMLHGNIFLRYTNTDIFRSGNRGGNKIDMPNWFMVMMSKPAGKKGLLSVKAMLSLDRFTEGGNGYPLLFQSGETWNGKALVDRQHPHDLFSELSVGYSYAFNKNIDLFGYLGYPGEPALGAPAFMHRISSINNPDAPLGHHWQDATHITFGVGTLGFRYRQFKLEGSIFTGREPDEDRYGFDKPLFNSYSYRLSYNPSPNWALQFSQGFIKAPEALEPGVDVTRTTASILYSRMLHSDRHLDAAFIWGMNDKGEDHLEHSLLGEANFAFEKNALFTRYEFIQKSADELELADELGHRKFDIHAFSLGYNRRIFQKGFLELAAGTKATLHWPAKSLQPIYGKMPVGLQVYLQLRPSLHRH